MSNSKPDDELDKRVSDNTQIVLPEDNDDEEPKQPTDEPGAKGSMLGSGSYNSAEYEEIVDDGRHSKSHMQVQNSQESQEVHVEVNHERNQSMPDVPAQNYEETEEQRGISANIKNLVMSSTTSDGALPISNQNE